MTAEHLPKVQRGVRALRSHLKNRLFDLRRADFDSFKRWLTKQISYWEKNAAFVARCQIREIRRSHPKLIELERQTASRFKMLESLPAFEQFESLKRSIFDTDKAIDGLTSALTRAPAAKRDALNEKLGDFKRKHDQLESDLTELAKKHPEKADYDRSAAELAAYRKTVGITAAEEHLREVQQQRGRKSGKSGTSFEEISRQVVEQHIVGDFVRATTSEESRRRIRVLSGVTLGAARAEIDQMVVRLPRGRSTLVEVLAIVEAKRNINDLDIGFRHRQDNLAWFAGRRDHYDATMYRTSQYPDGHFEGEAVHQEDGEDFEFDASSFRRFEPDRETGYYVGRLYFVTTPGRLYGMSSDEMSRLQHRCCTDFAFDLGNDKFMTELWQWARQLSSEFEGPDVFEVYASKPKWGRNVFLVA